MFAKASSRGKIQASSRPSSATAAANAGPQGAAAAATTAVSAAPPAATTSPAAPTSPTRFLLPIRIVLVQKGMGKARRDFFAENVARRGGVVTATLDDAVTHVVADESMTHDAALAAIRSSEHGQPAAAAVVCSRWLSECFKQGRLVPSEEYLCPRPHPLTPVVATGGGVMSDVLRGVRPTSPSSSGTSSPEKRPRLADAAAAGVTVVHQSGVEECGDREKSDSEAEPGCALSQPKAGTSSPAITGGRWKCMEPSGSNSRPNYNSHITTILQKMVDAYESTADKWRAFGYQKAINALKSCQKEIRTYEEALALPGVGKRLAEKIWEIIDSGELRKLEHFENDEEVKAVQLFSGIWGVGPETARIWVQQGLRTLDDVRSKAKMTTNQKIGLSHYDDFAEKMPREEAAEIVKTVINAVNEFGTGFVVEGCGSYRRGRQTCGDVDLLITHPDGRSHEGLLAKLLVRLHDTGFLTDDLSVVHDTHLNHQKYMGVCKLSGADNKFRRLDILITHHRHFACALMHFTGSALFNRSMRSLAISKGMMLTEYSLNTDVVKKEDGERLHDGRQLPTPTEESIFELLGVPYRKPEERDW